MESDRLDSWRQIAAHLGRSERTVRRWHETEGLPVHKRQDQPRGSVWAYRRELDGWLESRRSSPAVDETREQEQASRPAWRGTTQWVSIIGLLVAAAGWMAFRSSRVAAPPGEPSVIPLTTYPGMEQEPAWSPDGATVAFTWDGGGGNPDIYTLRVGDGTPKRLTAHPMAESSPTWASDGMRIAFLRGGGRERTLVIHDLRDGSEETIAEVTGSVAAWEGSGKAILIGEGEVPGPRMTRVSVANGEKSAVDLGESAIWPAPLPDGGTLFGRWRSSAWVDLWMAPVGGRPRALTEGMRMEGVPAISPDGRAVVFAADPHGRPVLFRVPVSGGAPAAIPALGENVFHPALARSPDGRTQLVYERRRHALDIVTVDLENGKESAFVESTRSETNPHFSPDGRRFAFSSDRSGNWEIWTARRDGGEPVQLTRLGRRRCGVPRYSPDGKYVAFDSALPDSDFDVFVAAVDGGAVHRMTSGAGEDGRPSWSRDGRFLYFFSERSGSRQIWKTAFPDGTPVQITRNGGYEAFESMDGKFLYYTIDEERSGLRRVPVNGGAEEEAVEGVRQGYWAVTAKGIYYLNWTAAQTGLAVRLWDPQSKADRLVATPRHRVFRPAPGFAVTADGMRAAISVVAESESDLMLVRDFH